MPYKSLLFLEMMSTRFSLNILRRGSKAFCTVSKSTRLSSKLSFGSVSGKSVHTEIFLYSRDSNI